MLGLARGELAVCPGEGARYEAGEGMMAGEAASYHKLKPRWGWCLPVKSGKIETRTVNKFSGYSLQN